jgi:ABC-type lipoprotein release transport system permease subunit
MSPLLSAWQIVIKRSLANWRLLSTVLVGVIVAVALLSSAPLYSNAINDLGLKHTLENRVIELIDLQVYAPNYYVNQEEYTDATALIEQQVSRNIRPVIRQQEIWVKSQTFYAYYTDRPTPEGQYQPKGHFQIFSNLIDHIDIIDGRYYEAAPAGLTEEQLEDPDFAIEGLIGSETAEKFQVGVGDYLIFEGGYGDNKNQLKIKLVGIIDPKDPNDELWFLNTDIFTVPQGSEEPPVAPIFIPQETLFNVYPYIFKDGRATFNWLYFVDIEKINSTNADTIKNAIRRMEKQLLTNLPRSGLFTILDSIIIEYQGKLMFTQIPLFLIVFQIAAIILYYLITVSNMLIDREQGEIALFRSRGASTWQVIGIYIMEGVVISAVGAAIGPFLGAFAFSLLGRTASFLSLTGGGLLPIRYSNSVLILAVTAAALCLLALLVPAIQAARRGVVHQRQAAARPPTKPFWQRYYLDIVLLILGGVLYWELHSRGSLLTMDVFGGLGMDPLLLITPMLMLVAVAIVFLRIFPLLISLATRLSKYVGNAPFVLGLWYMARNPVHYSRLILLLVMAASVGMFSATFLGTLDKSYVERTMYTAGGDVRLTDLNNRHSSKDSLEERYTSVEGVENVGVAYRNEGRVGTMFTETEFTMLAVDPEQMRNIAWFREDFADITLGEIMDILEQDKPVEEGILIPDGSETIGGWFYSEEDNLPVEIYVRVKDGKGRYMDISLGMPEPGSWQFLENRLTLFSSNELLPPPVSLSCIYIRTEGGGGFGGGLQALYMDNLQVTGPYSAEPVIIEDFEDVSEWQVSPDDMSGSLSGSQSATGTFRIDKMQVHNGESSGRFGWNSRGSNRRAIYANLDDRPLAAVVSRSFLENARVQENSFIQARLPGQYMYITAVDTIEYFPSLDPGDKGFILVNLDRLLNVRNRQLSSTVYPNEVWLTLSQDSELRAAAVSELEGGTLGAREFYYRDEMLEKLQTDPLAGAGWGGMLTIAFLGVILVSSLGFIVYSYLSAQQRQLDFAILRTLGFSLRQIIGLVCFEQLFIIIVGMGLGTIIGERLSYIMMPFLQLTEQGVRVLPPFILTVNWGTIGMAYALLAVAFIITISLVILFFSRVAIHKTLRMGDL